MSNHSTDSGKVLPNPATPMFGGSFGGPGSTKLGNEAALNVGKGGPGAGRTVMRSGSQHDLASSPAPIGPTKDTLAEFGADFQNAKTRT